MCFDYQNNITNEKEDLMFASKLELFFIGTISLPLETLDVIVINTIHLERTIDIIDSTRKLSCNFRSNAKTTLEKKPKVSLEVKVHFETYY